MTTIFTVNGFMGDMWQGPQADTGRYLSANGLAYWQPVGYDSSGFPLSRGVNSGLPELRHQIDLHPGPFVISSWSLGSIIAVEWFKQALAGGPQANRLPDFKAATTFGNPYRQAGKWAPKTGVGSVPDPGGQGIGGPLNNLSNTPDWWHDYAHTGDLYTCCPVGAVGDDIRIVFDFVLERWGGALIDLWTEAQELVTGPLKAAPSILWAVIQAIIFYGGGTKQHVNYDPHPSMNYLAGVAHKLLA